MAQASSINLTENPEPGNVGRPDGEVIPYPCAGVPPAVQLRAFHDAPTRLDPGERSRPPRGMGERRNWLDEQAEGCDYGGANGATRAWVSVAER